MTYRFHGIDRAVVVISFARNLYIPYCNTFTSTWLVKLLFKSKHRPLSLYGALTTVVNGYVEGQQYTGRSRYMLLNVPSTVAGKQAG